MSSNPEEMSTEHWVQMTCLERLAEPTNSGLSEAVLCAAVSHRAPDEIGSVVPSDVKRALKRLEEAGRVSHSAGRWRRLR